MPEVVLHDNAILGGSGGDRRDDTVVTTGRIARIRYREGEWMDAFGFDEIVGGAVLPHEVWGGDGGTGFTYPGDPEDVIPDWAYINGIYVQWGNYIDFIKLYIWNRASGEHWETLRMGKEKRVPADREKEYYFDPKTGNNREICGFAARSHTYLDAIGIYVRQHQVLQSKAQSGASHF